MKNRYGLILCGFLLLSVAAGYLLGRFAPRPVPRRAGAEPSFAELRLPLPEVGSFYSVDNADGGYRVIKVLARSQTAAEVRLFGNHFPERPTSIHESELTLEPADGYAGPGFDSVSVTPRAFVAWKPRPIVSAAP